MLVLASPTFDHQDKGSIFIRNTGEPLSDFMVSHPRRITILKILLSFGQSVLDGMN
jgi:hypothetical protein